VTQRAPQPAEKWPIEGILCRLISLVLFFELPSGKHTKNYGKSPFSMGKSTISMAIFNSYFDITRGYPFPAADTENS
jgi:hypothetical protein